MSLDPSALESYREFMGEEADSFIATITSMYIENVPGLIRDMEDALKDADRVTLVRAAHTLKSNSATIGARKLAEMSADLEKAGKDSSSEELAVKIAQAKDELDKVLQELRLH
jgi:HPt (histidine-containing phosphotransfer) domain-containing protein